MRVIGIIEAPGFVRVQKRAIPFQYGEDLPIDERYALIGVLRYDPNTGAYIDVESAIPFHGDVTANDCLVHGWIKAIHNPVKTLRGKYSQSLILCQTKGDVSSQVLITAVSPQKLDSPFSHLSAGDEVTLEGFITYQNRGLQVIYAGTVRKEAPTHE